MEFPYERMAIRKEPVPDGLDLVETWTYLALVSLYDIAGRGSITFEQGKEAKQKITRSWKVARDDFDSCRDLTRYIAKLRKDIELAASDYRKNRTIENADRLLNIIDGFERL